MMVQTIIVYLSKDEIDILSFQCRKTAFLYTLKRCRRTAPFVVCRRFRKRCPNLGTNDKLQLCVCTCMCGTLSQGPRLTSLSMSDSAC